MRVASVTAKLTWITTRGDCEKYHSGRPKRLMRAVLVSYVSEQRVLRMLPPAGVQEKSILHPSVTEVMNQRDLCCAQRWAVGAPQPAHVSAEEALFLMLTETSSR